MKTFDEFLVEQFSKDMIADLKAEYSKLTKIDPSSKSYKSLIKLLDDMDQAHLKQLAAANIKFVSALAKNRLKK